MRPGHAGGNVGQVEDLNPTAVICMAGIRVFPGTRLAEIAREKAAANGLESPGTVFLPFPKGPGPIGSPLVGLSEVHPNWIFPGLA